ncbi:transcriptional regulator, ArsR family [Streptomyces sp. cf386]|uniref:winged helix-turn-helix domain-containing protein n=1 Tax=Streptomyces sp. cf386 TaxID=1761904 RepID=UPI00088B3748|nr:winged helix-turn-helix domain-containing protein [Streptomyces sp. cf386]SDN01764.1 transcriptional regulator, ArsR family [Streptomyces sp. cf386]
MTLRIHFTADDLARTTVAAGPDMMWELVSSLHRLQAPRAAARYGPWLRHARARLGARNVNAAVRLLTVLVPRRGSFPDFLTPSCPGGDFGESLELVHATPAGRLRRELAGVFRRRKASHWVRRLAGGDRSCRQELQSALTVYYREVVRPYRSQFGGTVLTERALCGRRLVDGGVDRLLRTLSPSVSWTAPVLSTGYPSDRDLHLRGRGLTLIPSFFCSDTPVSLIDPELPPVLLYPVTDPAQPVVVPDALAALLGHTRALAIRALLHPRSTSELALDLGVSAGTASRHATALRDAGLVTSARHGSTMLHVATELGRALARSH